MTAKNYGFVLAMLASSWLGACNSSTDAPTDAMKSAAPDYVIEGEQVRLEGGVSLLQSIEGDLNSDAFEDRAAILRLNSQGSGVFYYLNVFLGEEAGELGLVGSEFLGDRIEFDFIQIYGEASISSLTGVPIHPDDYGQVVVGFSFHGEDQAFSEPPDLYITRHWKVSNGKLVLLENN